MSTGDSIHRMWHARDVDEVIKVDLDFPDDKPLMQIGNAREIEYRSDKWGRECKKCGKTFVPEVNGGSKCPRLYCGGGSIPVTEVYENYVHTCTSRAPVYAPRADGDISAWDILNVPRGKLHITLLANMTDLTYRRNDGHDTVKSFRRALLCCTDKKTLLILRENGEPMVITGSKMRITAGGIDR